MEQHMIKLRLFGFNQQDTKAAARAPADQNTESPSSTPEPPENANGKRVLIVDDDPMFLKATERSLRSTGFQVRTATDASGAIAAVGETSVDAVVMDISFPADVANGGMGSWDGFQIMYWLRGLPGTKGARFVMVSGSDTPANRKRAKDLGAVAYLQKPVNHEQLFEAMRQEH
jgi:CheY-like chemotaxis protein